LSGSRTQHRGREALESLIHWMMSLEQ